MRLVKRSGGEEILCKTYHRITVILYSDNSDSTELFFSINLCTSYIAISAFVDDAEDAINYMPYVVLKRNTTSIIFESTCQ